MSSPIARGTTSRANAWRITVNGITACSPSVGKVVPKVNNQNGIVPVTKYVLKNQHQTSESSV